MEPRKWPLPARSQGSAAAPAKTSARPARSQWGALEYFVSLIYHMLFFGLIAGLSRSRFPIDLGLFFFFTNNALIEWALRKVGIRLVPGSLGETFVTSFVRVSGVSILFTHWKDAAPAWLMPWLLPDAPWSLLAGVAIGCAVLTTISTMVVRKVLPSLGIEIARDGLAWTITEGVVGFAVLGLLFLLLSVLPISK